MTSFIELPMFNPKGEPVKVLINLTKVTKVYPFEKDTSKTVLEINKNSDWVTVDSDYDSVKNQVLMHSA